jgi:hypothetical protein
MKKRKKCIAWEKVFINHILSTIKRQPNIKWTKKTRGISPKEVNDYT